MRGLTLRREALAALDAAELAELPAGLAATGPGCVTYYGTAVCVSVRTCPTTHDTVVCV